MTTIIPAHFAHAQTFVSREVYRTGPKGTRHGPWTRDDKLSEPTVEDKLNVWQEQTGAQIVQVTAPSVQVYSGDTEKELVRFVGVSILYFPATEAIDDSIRAAEPTVAAGNEGPVAAVAGKPDTANEAVLRKSKRPARSRK
jgi:hypothetical protein